MTTYSFLSVQGTLTGSGININLANGASVAEEGITIEKEGDKDTVTMGADGSGMHSMSAAENGTVTVRYLKTSRQNQALQAAYNATRLSPTTWAGLVISLNDTNSGDSVTATDCAFKKNTGLTYATKGGMNEWVFTAIKINIILGVVG